MTLTPCGRRYTQHDASLAREDFLANKDFFVHSPLGMQRCNRSDLRRYMASQRFFQIRSSDQQHVLVVVDMNEETP